MQEDAKELEKMFKKKAFELVNSLITAYICENNKLTMLMLMQATFEEEELENQAYLVYKYLSVIYKYERKGI